MTGTENRDVGEQLDVTTYTTEPSDLDYRMRSSRPQFSLNLSLDVDDVARPDQLGYMFQKALSLEQHTLLRIKCR